MRRRAFITLPAQALGGALVVAIAGEDLKLRAQNGAVRVPLRFFTEAEAKVVAAACARIFPTDAAGPGAHEAGVVIYIDRQLAGPYGADKYRYTHPPFEDGGAEHGYQGKESPREVYRAGVTMLAGLPDLTPARQDEKLRSIEKSYFFQMLRAHTIEGMFCDPMHGGNTGLVGWRLIGFPGPHMSYRGDIDKHFSEAFRPKPVSLEQVVGHPVRGWEEEG
ncbi:MAG: gluconate 2-dehydrogenase subunit 3 family protein [Acidobacteriota bacterium]|nr:gluconate 2-dehydrogenase subunit 3 family protein [Acidobacteriota bacterium]